LLHEIVGACVSTIVTVNEQLFVFKSQSVAVQLTVLVPFENVLPDAGVQTTFGAGGQISVAVTVKLTTAEHSFGSVDCVMGEGQLMVGGVRSLTRTTTWQLAELPQASVALIVTLVVPRLIVEPAIGDWVSVTGQLSDALAWPVSSGSVPWQLLLAATTMTLVEQLSVSVADGTVIAVEQVLLQPLLSMIESISVAELLQLLLAWTFTDWLEEEPTIDASPVIDQA
jgi:hypothetical protein